MKALIAFILIGAFISGRSAPGDAAACNGKRGEGRSGWTWTDPPSDLLATGPITNYAVDPLRQERIWVTDGVNLVRSLDGGCHWDAVYATQPVASSAAITIRTIAVTTSKHPRIYLVVVTGAQGTGRFEILSSDDLGETWSPADSGLSPVGTPLAFRVAPSHPETMYLLVEGAMSSRLLYRTDDAGTTWALVEGALPPEVQTSLRHLEVDPLDADSIWGWWTATVDAELGKSELVVSRDGGATWRVVSDVATMTSAVDIWHRKGHNARVVAFHDSTDFHRSDDNGRTWYTFDHPRYYGGISAAHGSKANDLLISTFNLDLSFKFVSRVYRYAGDGGWYDVTPAEGQFSNVTATATKQPSYFVQTDSRIWIYSDPEDLL